MPSSTNPELRSCWPDDVGVLAIELYFPSQYVDQTELETFDGVSAGKYTVGLGQAKMGFCCDQEDINSLCLTVVHRLMQRNNIGYESIGRLEVGTETLLDKSKSVKSVLMQLFESSGNTDVEGVDTTNACYGGTSALFNAIAWVESSAWDGRYSLVVCGDIAVYASGNARCTGGAGAVAMLIGPNAPLVFERGLRSTHMRHVYDFYKPDMTSEYPVVDGKLSIECYLGALDKCYQNYCKKADMANKKDGNEGHFSLDSLDAMLFHAPYCKLVQKSFARLSLIDFLRDTKNDFKGSKYNGLEVFRDIELKNSYFDRNVEKAFMDFSKPMFSSKTEPSLLLASQVGNMYTSSLYGGLVAFLASCSLDELLGKRVGLFSYGSGCASSFFSLRVVSQSSPQLVQMVTSVSDLQARLESRTKVCPHDFDKIMKLREETHGLAPYTPVSSPDTLSDDSWYLVHVDELHRRTYSRQGSSTNHVSSATNGHGEA